MPQKTKKDPRDTPAMRQYTRFKDQHPDCLLLFRMGDFYELFFEDAEVAHRVLGVTLTQRTEGVPMAGVPYHAVESYLRRLIQAGHRVAIADQVEDASQAKGVVERDVTQVITPGTLTDDHLLPPDTPNTLAAVAFLDDETAALAWAELSTGSFLTAALTPAAARDELARIAPAELLYCQTADGQPPQRVRDLLPSADDAVLTTVAAHHFRPAEALRSLCDHYRTAHLEGFGYAAADPDLPAAAALIAYLRNTQRTPTPTSNSTPTGSAAPGGVAPSNPQPQRLPHLRPPRKFAPAEHLVLDHTTLRALEVETTLRHNTAQGSLLDTLQVCRTAMGKRRLRDWLRYPLARRDAIEQRQHAVTTLIDDDRLARELAEPLDRLHDVPRITARLGLGRATPRDLVALRRSTAATAELAALTSGSPALQHLHDPLDAIATPLTALADTLAAATVDDPPAHLREGGLIRDGHDAQLDEQRSLQRDANQHLAAYQQRLTEQTGVASLKVGFNKVFGYYIELSAVQASKLDMDHERFAGWSRKQTLKNAERFVTPELKEFESRVLNARERAIAREQDLFAELCALAADHTPQLQTLADAASDLDVLLCFAHHARRRDYCKPTLTDTPGLHATDARHPVLDELLRDKLVPNDIALGSPLDQQDAADPTLQLITGPNMAGKSTYIRTAALITLLAHTGGYVPAKSAAVGLTDRIFTRVGAADELHTGQSTFMVEMTETARICHHATDRSLVILDEVGRGTSTYDGLALASAIAEHLARRGCLTLFATHYHELTELADRLDTVGNLHVAVREWQGEVVFLHRVQPGSTDRSYGVHVARLAGVPDTVVDRADRLLGELTQGHTLHAADGSPTPPNSPDTMPGHPPAGDDAGLPLFAQAPPPHPALDELRETNLDAMSPLDAFDFLRRIKRQLENE
ncbi:MAG: DNA mismatch repair protein MutS [Planctomycetota bacterium]